MRCSSGPTMRPLTDHHRVSREKLAFLVDSTSARLPVSRLLAPGSAMKSDSLRIYRGHLGLGVTGIPCFSMPSVFGFTAC